MGSKNRWVVVVVRNFWIFPDQEGQDQSLAQGEFRGRASAERPAIPQGDSGARRDPAAGGDVAKFSFPIAPACSDGRGLSKKTHFFTHQTLF